LGIDPCHKLVLFANLLWHTICVFIPSGCDQVSHRDNNSDV